MSQLLRFATFLAPNMRSFYQFMADYIGRELGLATQLYDGQTFSQFSQGQADVGFICGLPYVRLARERPSPVELLAAPVLQGDRFQNKPVYYSDVIVKKESLFESFADLRGRVWAYNEPDSHSGYNITMYHLAKMKETVSYFSQFVSVGTHQRAIHLVCEGRVDAAAIDCHVLAMEMRQQPYIAQQLRIIDSFGPSPIQPVVASAHLSTKLKAAVKTVLLNMANDPMATEVLSYNFIKRFTEITDVDYDEIRLMSNLANTYHLAKPIVHI